MKFKNPQTTLLGLTVIAASIASIWVPPEYRDKINGTLSILSALGLLKAVDPGNSQEAKQKEEDDKLAKAAGIHMG